MTEKEPISAQTWDKIVEAAKEIIGARSNPDKQKSLRAITKVISNELDIDFGTPW
jgi:hypothetical protein